MEIYPAVDLYQGEVVRLQQGDYERRKVYSKNPAEIAQKWTQAGARWLHVVDLEGARSGSVKNWSAIGEILNAARAKIQFGGGVRTRAEIERLFRLGVERVILGSKAMDPVFLKEVTEAFPGKIMLSLDLKGEKVQIEGWLKPTGLTVFELLNELRKYRIHSLVVTDIERDGMLQGLNLEKMKKIAEKTEWPFILSGGVSSLEDIRAISKLRLKNLEGVITGKALYEGKMDLKEALSLARGEGVRS